MTLQSTFKKQFSCEFSAPKSEEASAKLLSAHDRLAALGPAYFSVTYGAGGSTKDGTKQAVLISERKAQTWHHICLLAETARTRLKRSLREYKNANVTRVVALRGDMPSGMGGSARLTYANELVDFIREKTGDHFHIEVAAYPEVHPDSRSVESDLDFFKAKVDAGANSAITQYFYNPAAYFNFIDACEKKGVSIPIIPGIMPISNFQTLVRFSDMCGADIPRWIRKNLEYYQDDKESLKAFGHEVVLQLCQDLLTGGAPGLHFYTLNQSKPTIRLWRDLGL